jgi:hypothetical protein
MGDICDVNTDFKVAIRELTCVESIVDILTARRVNTADEQIPEVPASPPTNFFCACWYSPIMAL